MNEQQLQQILTIQQAIAAAATAAIFNTLLQNPQQAAANLVNQQNNQLSDSATPSLLDSQEQDRDSLPDHERPDNPLAALTASNLTLAAANNLSLQQANQQQQQQPHQIVSQQPTPTPQSNQQRQSPNHHNSSNSNKKLKRQHNHQAPQSFSRQHNAPSSSSTTFLPNNVGLPRKLVRGQDVWLGRGAEQTRQILKCMWCNQSFRTLAEMTQHMKITQHYTNIISQEQITSWKQPEGSEAILSNRQQSKQSISSKNLDDIHETTSSDKSIDSDRDDCFSNDEELSLPQAPQPPLPPPPSQRQRTKSRSERSSSSNKHSTKTSPNSNSNSNTNSSNNLSITNVTNIDSSNNNKMVEQQQDDSSSSSDEVEETNDENKCKRETTSREESLDNDEECDNIVNNKKRSREDDSEVLPDTDLSLKQEAVEGQKDGNGTGDPLSALETMVEKSFDPRMRPDMASGGGILQRLGIDEEVCPPWQHINYANWYAAAAYGHPMAAAIIAAGINLQNGIKLSKNMATKKSADD